MAGRLPPDKRHRVKLAVVLVTFAWIVWLGMFTGCDDAADVYSPEEWRDLFKEAGGWTPLPFPDSKYRPGSIIKVGEDGIRWIDNLEACRYPIAQFEEKSYIPGITFEKAWAFGASSLIHFKGISAGPRFDKISRVRLEVQDHGADALRIIKLKVWLEDPDHRSQVSQACMDELLKPDRYLVTEAFRVSKGKYVLQDQSGGAIKLEAPVLKELLQFQPDVKYEVTADGGLRIEQPAYFAVRKAVRLGEDFEVLGGAADASVTADAQIEDLFLKTAKSN
jgi:hypothetical protein